MAFEFLTGTVFVIIVSVLLVLIFIFLFEKYWKQRLIKKYNPDDDLAKKGEELRRTGQASGRTGETIVRDGAEDFAPSRPSSSERRQLLPSTDVSNVGKNSKSNRKSRKFFRRRNQKR